MELKNTLGGNMSRKEIKANGWKFSTAVGSVLIFNKRTKKVNSYLIWDSETEKVVRQYDY